MMRRAVARGARGHQAVRRRDRTRRRRLHVERRGAGTARRQRRRQVDADQGDQRRASSRLGHDHARRRATSPTPRPPPPARAGSRRCTRTWRCSTISPRQRTSSPGVSSPVRPGCRAGCVCSAVGRCRTRTRELVDRLQITPARLRCTGRVDVGRPTPGGRRGPRRRLLVEAGDPRRADRRPRACASRGGCST